MNKTTPKIIPILLGEGTSCKGRIMRPLLMLLATALACADLAACGSAPAVHHLFRTPGVSSPTAYTASERPPTRQEYTLVDRDHDEDNAPVAGKDNDSAPYDEKNNDEVLDFGVAADSANRSAISALVKRYFAAALREDGASACSMLDVRIAESVAEDHGRGSAGPRYLSSGTTCPQVMTLLFEHFHERLVAQVPLLRIARVRLVGGHHGLAILRFGTMPERKISVRRQGAVWKISTIFDSPLP